MRAGVGCYRDLVAVARQRRNGFAQILDAELGNFPHQGRREIGSRAVRLAVELVDVDDQTAEQQRFDAGSGMPCLRDLFGGGVTTESFPASDQYTIQGDAFSRAVRGEGEVPMPIEDSIKNMAVIEALFRSGESGKWEQPQA